MGAFSRHVIVRRFASLLLVLLPLAGTPCVAGEERLAFIGVALDVETRQADRILQDYLRRTADIEFAPEELEYGRVIDRLANWGDSDGHYLARTTPYVYVGAEMLGADFEVLATYVSATTNRRTYHAYFVVNRRDFPAQPRLEELLRWLEQKREPARFIYHSKFSTSSFFLPSLYFRGHGIFHMPESTESLTAIHAERIEQNSSTELVRRVARGEADLASVWDGTTARFEPGGRDGMYDEFGSKVWFIRLPTALPNDLLVCSGSLDPDSKKRLKAAIGSMDRGEIGQGDFDSWQVIKDATDARLALADLRWSARQRTTPVIVEVRLAYDAEAAHGSMDLLEAIRQAVRLTGSEFVLYDQDFHEHIDFRWTVEPIHDGAILLRSAIPGSEIPEQVFQLSFADLESLTQRIASLIHSRMHRIRYIWPYSDDPPIVIRDTAASIATGSTVKVQRISWLDPVRNWFRAGVLVDARIREAGFYKYELEPDDFLQVGERGLNLNALSNEAYRVVFVSPDDEQPLFRALTVAFVSLLVLAAGGAVFDLRRRSRSGPVVGVSSTAHTRSFAGGAEADTLGTPPPAQDVVRPADSKRSRARPAPKRWH